MAPSKRPNPTLGFQVLDWITENLTAPDKAEPQPFIPTHEQARFILRYYEIDPLRDKRKYRRGVLSRPRGWGKSPLLAALACVESLGPVVFDGWDAQGEPVGKPWMTVRTPLVQIAAVSEAQTKNSWTPLLEMLDNDTVVNNHPGLEPLDTFVNLPRGKIEPVTSAATSRKGNRAVFAVMDQTEEWTKSNGGIRLAEVMRINAAKVGGTTVESPNAYTPGMDSVAELSAQFYKMILEGRARDDGLLYDHREAPPETDLSDRESLLAGLAHVYGDSAGVNGGWVDLDTIVATIWDPGTDVQTARADFLNQITHASDSWLSSPEWEARKVEVLPKPGELITLGFDGSRERRHSVTDATALIGCRVLDGHLFELGVWEQPDGMETWRVPVASVEAAVRSAFLNYKVAAFYADPPKWETHVAQWEAEHGSALTVKASREHPIEWWTGRPGLMVAALDQFHSAVLNGDLTHSGESALTRHVLNARRRPSRSGIQVAKEFPESPRKIDAAIAAVLAWQARLDVMARPQEKPKTYEAVFA